MKHSESEIIKSLTIIKETCEEFECDNNCPFFAYGDCVINDLCPDNWSIVDRKVFKAFN